MTLPIVHLVSLNFPPSQIASVHRARHLAKHLPGLGWRPIVIAVDERQHKEAPDPQLGALVPAEVEVHRVEAIPPWLTQPLGLGDLAIRALPFLWRKLSSLIQSAPPRAVLFTGWPFYQMLLAGAVHRRGIPVVLDFQDPWVSRWGAAQPPLSKAGLSHRLATWLEPRVLRSASFITSVSDVQNAEMAARYPWLDRTRMAAIPIGGDPEDFEHLRRGGLKPSGDLLAPGCINLSFVGTYADRFEPVVRTLFASVRRLRETEPALARRLRLNFIGTSALVDGHQAFRIRPLAEEIGVTDMVYEAPRRLPFLDALAVMAHSDGLVLIGSDEPHYTASRIYPALMSGRPFLSLYHAASSAHTILKAAGGGIALAFSDHEDLRRIEPKIAAALACLAITPESLGMADPSAYAAFEAAAIARRYADIFDALAANR